MAAEREPQDIEVRVSETVRETHIHPALSHVGIDAVHLDDRAARTLRTRRMNSSLKPHTVDRRQLHPKGLPSRVTVQLHVYQIQNWQRGLSAASTHFAEAVGLARQAHAEHWLSVRDAREYAEALHVRRASSQPGPRPSGLTSQEAQWHTPPRPHAPTAAASRAPALVHGRGCHRRERLGSVPLHPDYGQPLGPSRLDPRTPLLLLVPHLP